MEKQKIVKQAYGEYFEKCNPDENGWCDYDTWFKYVGHKIYYDFSCNKFTKVRPKSLSGIENNNGWTKIESEADLPKRDGLYFLFGEGGVGMGKFFELQNIFKTFNGNVYSEITHYQPIKKPQPPIY